MPYELGTSGPRPGTVRQISRVAISCSGDRYYGNGARPEPTPSWFCLGGPESFGAGYVKDVHAGADRRETGPKTRLCPRAHAYDACLWHTWKSSAALGKVKLWKLKVPLPADLCEKPPSEGCRGFQSLEVPKEEPWHLPCSG